MFGILTGSIVNAGAIVLGTVAGIVFKTPKLKKIGERIFQMFALFVMVMGFEGAMGVSEPIPCLLSVIIGVALGELVDLDAKFNSFGNWLERKMTKKKPSDESLESASDNEADSSEEFKTDGNFAEGFVQASLLFGIGSMAIMGALQSGLQNEHTILYTKSVLDMISSCTMAMGLGFGVGFSALSILIYEGLLTLGASVLAPVLTDATITLSVQIGSLCLIGIATNMFGITRLKVANFLPAMFMPMIWQGITMLF